MRSPDKAGVSAARAADAPKCSGSRTPDSAAAVVPPSMKNKTPPIRRFAFLLLVLLLVTTLPGFLVKEPRSGPTVGRPANFGCGGAAFDDSELHDFACLEFVARRDLAAAV